VPREPDLPGVPAERAKWLKFYLCKDWVIFPCFWRASPRFKQPCVPYECLSASNDADVVAAWWRRWPQALIGVRCGPVPAGSGINVLDLDVKHDGQNGIATVVALIGKLPRVPMVWTPSGGRHLYFAAGREAFGNTSGARGRGIGVGCDWRSSNGYVVAPGGDGDGLYSWDAAANLTTLPLIAPPGALLPKEQERADAGSVSSKPLPPIVSASAYAEAALARACHAIREARAGEQYCTLNRETFGMGQLCGAGLLPGREAFARLLGAALAMPTFDSRRPWVRADVERKVMASFRDGLHQPRRPATRRVRAYG
jgi:hypothetical protein